MWKSSFKVHHYKIGLTLEYECCLKQEADYRLKPCPRKSTPSYGKEPVLSQMLKCSRISTTSSFMTDNDFCCAPSLSQGTAPSNINHFSYLILDNWSIQTSMVLCFFYVWPDGNTAINSLERKKARENTMSSSLFHVLLLLTFCEPILHVPHLCH